MSVKTPKIIAVTALALCLGLTAWGAGAIKPAPEPVGCPALDYLASPQVPVSIAATVVSGTGPEALIRDVEFDYADAKNVRGRHFERGRNLSSTVAIHDGRKYRYSQTAYPGDPQRGTLTEIAEGTPEQENGTRTPSVETAALTSMHINSLGLGAWLPGNYQVQGTTVRVKNAADGLPFITSMAGTARLDASGRLEQIELTGVYREDLQGRYPGGLLHTITYRYSDDPNIAKGFPSGWTETTRVGDQPPSTRTVTVHRWTKAPSSAGFAPGAWASRVDMQVLETEVGAFRVTTDGLESFATPGE